MLWYLLTVFGFEGMVGLGWVVAYLEMEIEMEKYPGFAIRLFIYLEFGCDTYIDFLV